jgi:16S rRNA (adenine1518-N6/adenine1519-N6)-dimethyltransferase
MLQREVADRLLGQPGQKAYGIITILIGYYARIIPLMQLGPNAFSPRPKVASTFVGILFDSDRFPGIEKEELFQWLVRAAFHQRRKQLKNALVADGRLAPEMILKALAQNNIDPKNRGERLTISQFVALSNSLADLAGRDDSLTHEL